MILLVTHMRYFRAHVKNRYLFKGAIINLYITADVLSLFPSMRYFRAHVKGRCLFEGTLINLYVAVDVLSFFQIDLCFFLTQRYNSYKKMYRLGMGPTFRNNLNY
jgi:hypothetical protein